LDGQTPVRQIFVSQTSILYDDKIRSIDYQMPDSVYNKVNIMAYYNFLSVIFAKQ